MIIKRLISFALCVLLISSASLFFISANAIFAPDSADRAFAAIDASITAASAFRSELTDTRKTQIAKQTVEKLGYQTQDRGDGCFVFTVGGEPCIFNCRMYNRISEMKPLEGFVDDGKVVTVDYSKRATGSDIKDVVLIEPFYGIDKQFTEQYQKECSRIAMATGGTYTLYKTSAATIDAIADGLESGAVVVIDSHGDTDYYNPKDDEDFVTEANTSYLLLSTGTGLTAADKSKASGEFGTYYHAMNAYGSYYVDGTAITNHMEQSAPNSFVWMAICLGMATDGMVKPLREHGVGAVYGYSQSVTFSGDYQYEKTFWDNMIDGKNVQVSIEAMKQAHGNWDPGMGCSSFSSARKNYAAFPIVVSDRDAYPGHGNVDNYQTVYSDWELFGSSVRYNINALSSNEVFGTVSLNGSIIDAEPKIGYEVEGFSVSPEGACKVIQEGNRFVVSELTSDCTITIHFKPRVNASVTYLVPDGVACEAATAYVGDALLLPMPNGTPNADRHRYSFVGWVTQETEETSERPTVFPAGTSVTLKSDMTFYALYSYSEEATGSSDGFRTLASSKPDYSGDYVIGFEEAAFLDAGGAVTGTAIGGKNAVVSLADSGVVVHNGGLFNVPSDLVFEVSLYDEAAKTYTIRMKGSQDYLFHTLLGNALSTTQNINASGTQWKIMFDAQMPEIKNASTGKYLQYNTANQIFRCYTAGLHSPVSLYYGGFGTIYYTTELLDHCDHEWGEAEPTAEATCTQNGLIQYRCAICGTVKTEQIPALGHDWSTGYYCANCGELDPNYQPPNPIDPCEGYVDIDRNSWYHTAADYAIVQRIMGSTDSNRLTFEPMTVCTRGMVATILYSLAGKPAVVFEDRFPDVQNGNWFTAPILWAYQSGIASGYDNGLFGTNDNITREQMVVMLKAYAENNGEKDTDASAELSGFVDADKVTWSRVAVEWAVAKGLISCKLDAGELLLDPQGSATRAEVAVILMQYLSESIK